MESQQSSLSAGSIQAENIGGIEETTVEFEPGVTILVGRNATNRTSLLQAVMAALGSDQVSMKGDADEASVELSLGDGKYTRTLRRGSNDIVTEGDPYLDDPTLADLFAFLLNSNEARRAVVTDADLRELIMRPVDTDEIQATIDGLVNERESLEAELERIDELKGKLPELETRRTDLSEKIEAKKRELESKEAELEAADADVEETRAEKSELEDKLDELRSKRASLDDVRYDLETERESLEALERERNELEAEYEALPDTPVGEIEEIESRTRRLREQKQRLESEISDLQSVIGFNEEMLDDANADAFDALVDQEGEHVTDGLLDDDDVTCWTCGSAVEREQIESTLGELRTLSQTKVGEVSDLEEALEEAKREKRELEQSQRERERIERRLDELDAEIEDGEETIARLQERKERHTEEITEIEAAVEELENEEYSAILDLHKEANQLEYELGKLESDLDRVESEIADIESRIDERSTVESQLDEVKEEITAQRTKIERIEQGAIEQFNEHMDHVLDILDYQNLDRIWLERRETEVREGRRTVTKSVFDLHVVRTTASGNAYEDTVDHLSESEQEVTGLVFALAGYLAHEVYEQVPFMLLDSLEAIDAERIAALVEYLESHTGYLLVALLPDDAAALPETHDRVTRI